MKKSIPKVRERESEASILGNDREREFPLTPETFQHGHGAREVIQDEPGANIEKLGDETEELNNNLNEVDQAFDECIASVKEWLRRN